MRELHFSSPEEFQAYLDEHPEIDTSKLEMVNFEFTSGVKFWSYRPKSKFTWRGLWRRWMNAKKKE